MGEEMDGVGGEVEGVDGEVEGVDGEVEVWVRSIGECWGVFISYLLGCPRLPLSSGHEGSKDLCGSAGSTAWLAAWSWGNPEVAKIGKKTIAVA